jgi:uncharacterized protein (DUF1778 family)
MKAEPITRFDTRLPKVQKDFFELAASIGGFRTLTEFVIYSAQQHANKIVEKHQTILASQKDRELFFKAIMNPPKPNDNLSKAAKRYNETLLGK